METYTHADLVKCIDQVFQKYEKKTAVMDFQSEKDFRKFSFGQIKAYTEKIGDALLEKGVQKTERVAVLARPTAYSAMLLLALSYLGYTAVLTDVSLPVEEQNRLLAFTEPSAIVTEKERYMLLEEGMRGTVPVFDLYLDGTFLRQINPEVHVRTLSEIPGDADVIAIIFSSGTTGSMKGAQVTHQAMIYSAKTAAQYAQYNDKTRFLHILPQTHVAGYAMLFINFLLGSEMAFVPEVSAAGLSMGLRTYEPTHLVMIPKVYETIHQKIEAEIAKRPAIVQGVFRTCKGLSSFVRRHTGYRMKHLMRPFYAPAFGRNIHVIGCGTAPCAVETVHFFEDLGICFLNVYGSTEESFPICCGNVTKEWYPDQAAGNARQFPFIDIKIEDGEIVVKSALEMKGYFRDPESTKEAHTKDGYLKTGDLGYINEKGYLYVTGRRKETIQLGSGNKVSATDIDRYYQGVCGDLAVAACGVPDADGMTEHVVLFLETGEVTLEEAARVKLKVRRLSDTTTGSYHLSDILCIPKLPCTTLGKVQRFKLRELALKLQGIADQGSADRQAEAKQQTGRAMVSASESEVVKEVCEIVAKHVADLTVTPNALLTEDLNLDSLSMFEICLELEATYHTDFLNGLSQVKTVRDLAALIERENAKGYASEKVSAPAYDIEKYPLKRRAKDRHRLIRYMKLSRKLYDFEVEGTQLLSFDGQYVFCPNHESHFDGLWVFTALQGIVNESHVACLAKQEHLDHAVSRMFLRMLGGIPTDRHGNPGPALKRAVEVLKEGKGQFLIHPEGTRTRDGKLGTFKGGAATIAMETGLALVPVCIIGAREIYPPDKALPRLRDPKTHERLRLKVKFGTPILPKEGDTAKELTDRLQKAVEELLREG